MSKFTEEDAKKLNTPLLLLKKWDQSMQILWSFFTAYAKAEKLVSIKNENNSIFFRLDKGHQYIICINMYNKKYLSLSIKIEGNEEFEATVNNIDQFGKDGMIRTVSAILDFAENVTPT